MNRQRRPVIFNGRMPHKMLVPDPDVEDVLRTLGDEVRRLRGGMSQAWLGRGCGLSQSTISRLESGQAPSLRLERYARVLAVLETGGPIGPWLPTTDDTRRLHIRTKNRDRRTSEPADDAAFPGSGSARRSRLIQPVGRRGRPHRLAAPTDRTGQASG